MAKLLVVDEQRATKVPFLRGMLTRSLQEAGLDFADAYRVASDIRAALGDTQIISNIELRKRIIDMLAEDFPNAVLTRYCKEDISIEDLRVVYADGHLEPFSRGIHALRLESCSLPHNRSNAITRRIHARLVDQKRHKITTAALTQITYVEILQDLGQEFADYYLIRDDLLSNHTPLILLIGGVPGSGKSTIATQLASRLNIVRTQSTDMLREVMRVLIPKRLSQVLHTSSFEAGKYLNQSDYLNAEALLISGFMRQAEMVEVACDAVIQRAINERVSIILEGVHIRPSLLQHIPRSGAIVVPITLGVFDKKRLISYIKGRSLNAEHRRAERYLNSIDQIWQLQEALLSDADSAENEIVNNVSREQSVNQIIKTIAQTTAATYKDKLAALRAKHQAEYQTEYQVE